MQLSNGAHEQDKRGPSGAFSLRAGLSLALALLCLIIAPMLLRVYVEGGSHLADARQAVSNKDVETAINEYSLAIAWSLPFTQQAEISFGEAMQLIRLELKEQDALVHAYWQIRRGLFSSRSLLGPRLENDPLVRQVDMELEKLSAAAPAPLMTPRPRANFAVQLLAQILFWAWIICSLTFIWRGFAPNGGFQIARGAPLLLLAVILYAGWLVSLLFA